ncbi:MAG: ribose 5-phosphate isomerase A [Planctomycetes bacterium]|nr:ribose 5-phosphate isomerase A [Planctomycetota bacterium]
MNEQRVADELADAAIAEIKSGMVVGLGTGRTAARGICALGERVRAEQLDIKCVATSEAAELLAKEVGLNTIDFAMIERLDYLFDGADEVDRQARLLKGSGGAMTRERMVAWASSRVVYMVHAQKLVKRLGTNTTLGIAIMAYGVTSIRAELRNLGVNGVCRRNIDGKLFITDNGNLILDVSLGDQNLEELAAALNAIPGVIDHGLFLTEADEILVEKKNGIERLIRPES